MTPAMEMYEAYADVEKTDRVNAVVAVAVAADGDEFVEDIDANDVAVVDDEETITEHAAAAVVAEVVDNEMLLYEGEVVELKMTVAHGVNDDDDDVDLYLLFASDGISVLNRFPGHLPVEYC